MIRSNQVLAACTLVLITIAGIASAAGPVPPSGAEPYRAVSQPGDGANLALSMEKLQGPADGEPFVIWAIGSSYTNMLGDGSQLIGMLKERFPDCPEIDYHKMVGNSVPYQYLRGWARHLVVPAQPDLVLTYATGKPEDLESLILEVRRHTTADIIVPTLHWREREQEAWPNSETPTDIHPTAMRQLCRKYDVEFVENRRDWGEYLAANDLPIPALLKDAVHQSDYGAYVINSNIAAHFRRPARFGYDPRSRERTIEPDDSLGDTITVSFTGNRIDLIGRTTPGGGTVDVEIDGLPAEVVPAFTAGYIQPHKNNAWADRSPPRDCSPHSVTLGENIIPQAWTIRMTSDKGDFQLVGSATGVDGRGNSTEPMTSHSGQIEIDPALWRRAQYNRTGDSFTFQVERTTTAKVSFDDVSAQPFRTRLAWNLPCGPHTVTLRACEDGPIAIDRFQVYQPPVE